MQILVSLNKNHRHMTESDTETVFTIIRHKNMKIRIVKMGTSLMKEQSYNLQKASLI